MSLAASMASTISSSPAVPAAADVRCSHCTLPVPAGLIEAGATHQFCCTGCRTVFEVIHGAGLERYYALREAAEATPARSQVSRRKFAEFDDPAFQQTYCVPLPGGLFQIELYLEGVHCAACVWLVEKLPQVAPGVLEARVRLRTSTVTLTFDPQRIALSQAARALDSLGYPPHPARDTAARRVRQAGERRMLIRIGVAGAVAGNVMLLSLALYSGMFDTMEAQFRGLFRWLAMGLAMISVCWPGAVFFRGAWAALRTRTAHLDLPLAIGIAVGAVAGVANTVRGTGEIYFDSITVLIFLLLVGRLIQQRQQRWAADAVELLFNLTPTMARRIRDGEIEEVSVQSLQAGDVVEVRAGDSIPADGEVVEGESLVDEKVLTGESRPARAAEGSRLFAGTVNLSGRLVLRVSATGEQTRVAALMRLVEESSRQRAPIVQMADRIAGRFVVTVLLLAAVTIAIGWSKSPQGAVENAIALLIVTCPCALGLATPLAMTVALGRAARAGILVKGGAALELLAGRGRVVLDKTGTVTAGQTALVRWAGNADALRLAAALEARSAHPIARALVEFVHKRAAEAEKLPPADAEADAAAAEGLTAAVEAFEEQTGGGVRGVVEGAAVCVGSPGFVMSAATERFPRLLLDAQQDFIAQGLTPVVVAVDGTVQAVAGFGDPLRADAKATLARLADDGWRPELLSGDHPAVVESVARQLGIPADAARGAATPESKLAYVRNLSAARAAGERVVMVGDGVNDAAALAAADVGVAVHGGAEASLAAADVYIQRPGLAPLQELFDGARRAMRTIRRAMRFSLAYNALGATLAMSGLLNPLVAAILMPISSLTVLTSRTRAGRLTTGGGRRRNVRDLRGAAAGGDSGGRGGGRVHLGGAARAV